MSSVDDVIEIPIEISLKSIKEIDKAKKDVDEVIKKQKKIKDTQSKQATPTLDEQRSGGILGGVPDVKGSAFRDKTSKAPFQRVNEFKKLKDETRKLKEQQDAWKTGNVAKVQGFSRNQFSNVQSVAKDPFQFIFGGIAKKLGKIGRAGLFIGIGLFIAEIVKFVITEQLKPGRSLDRRFKLLADKQILQFTERAEQAELRQGFRTIIVTTIQGLRGSSAQGQINTNLHNPDRIPTTGLDARLLISDSIAKGGYKFTGEKFKGRFGK